MITWFLENLFDLFLSGRQIKYYLEGSGGDPQAVKSFLHKAILDISENWIQAHKYNLRTP